MYRDLRPMIDILYDAMGRGVEPKVLHALMDRVLLCARRHFEHQEARMAREDYPGVEPHRLAHDEFMVKIQLLDHRLRDGGEVASLRLALGFLREWLTYHHHMHDIPFDQAPHPQLQDPHTPSKAA